MANLDREDDRCSRRTFLSTALVAPFVAGELVSSAGRGGAPTPGWGAAGGVRVTSPDRRIEFELLTAGRPRVSYRVTFRHMPVVETSALGLVVDAVELSEGAVAGRVERYRLRDRYAWNGVHSVAVDDCQGARIHMRHRQSGTDYVVEVRAFDDGIAFRCVVPGEGSRVPEEASSFVLPAGSTVWYHGLRGHYEGKYGRRDVADVKENDWAAPPVTCKLPGGAGYASITEAGLVDYAGMVLQADGRRGFRARLGNVPPASYPFTLRYGDEEAARLARPAPVTGTITSPWRVVMIGSDLNALVNCDIVGNVSPPPDPRYFPEGIHTDWVRPGRCVWKYLDGGGESTVENMKEFSRMAGELGFEYNLLEGFWRRWSEGELRDVIDYSRQHGVGIWLWQHSKELHDPAARAAFFGHLRDVGAVGAKVDFFDHEAREIIDLYDACMEEAAKNRIMLDFHGANKPTGESRTWPNELTREAVNGMERKSMDSWSEHDTTFPFARDLAGPVDFTPMLFGERRRETSWAHQIAMPAIVTSPLLVYGASPQHILANPAVELIKSIPSVWDETRVLGFSEIGEVAAFARRSGDTWFLAIANGPSGRTVDVPLDFLAAGSHAALLVRDRMDDPAAVDLERTTVRGGDSLTIRMRDGGGFVGRFSGAA